MPADRRRPRRLPAAAKASPRRAPAARKSKASDLPTLGFVFKVALKGAPGIWRRIAMRGNETLHHLHEEIYSAFDRDDEHLYSFYFPKPGARGRDRLRSAAEFTHPYATKENPFGETAPDASKAKLDKLRLKRGQKFDYLFDFGDSWWHEITVEDVNVQFPGGRSPRVLERRGTSPPQYPEVDSEE